MSLVSRVVGATAVLALAAGGAAVVAPPASASRAPACFAPHLRMVRAGTEGALSHRYVKFRITNTGRDACRLYGYPEVSAYRDSPEAGEHVAGGQIGGPAVRDTSVRPRPVMLEPGATAHAVLRVMVAASTESAQCTRVTAEELRVALPSQGRAAFVPAHILVCSSKGSVSLSVQAIQARPGVPGYAAMP